MRQSNATTRGGYTLSEVLVVLGVLVTVAALAQPALRTALGDSRLRSAARQVRAELAKTRLRAMQSGIAQRFRYQAGKNRFEIAPAAFDADAESTGEFASGRDVAAYRAGDQAETEAIRPGRNVVVQELPEGVSFESAEERLDSHLDDDGWSAPIVFHPNGRAADARIRLRGERDVIIDVALRGLTGVVTAGKPRHEEALR